MPSLDIRQRAIALLDQIPQNKLAAVVQLLEVLAEPVPSTLANPDEAPLLAMIQWQLPAPEQTRLDDLRDRCEWGEITDDEHQDLLHYEDRLEQHRVERLEALIALAKLRKLDLISLNQQFLCPTPSLQCRLSLNACRQISGERSFREPTSFVSIAVAPMSSPPTALPSTTFNLGSLAGQLP